MREYKYFIDTNIFIRVFIADDKKKFLDSFKLIEKIKFGEVEFYTSSLVLAEINWILSKFYKLPKEDVIMKLNAIVALKNLKIADGVDPLVSLKLYHDNSVKFIDSLIASNVLVQSDNMAVVSYDRDFDKMGVKRLEPSDLI